MAFEFAGFFGPGLVQDTEGDALPNTNVQVNNPDTTAATLYSDRLRATALSNPVTTNSRGQFEFYAEPGFYTVTANGVTRSIRVDPDPAEFTGYARRQLFNPVDYGVDLTGATTAHTAVNAAIAAAAAAPYKGQVFLPPGRYKLTSPIVPMSGVDIFGAGWSKTVLLPYNNISAIQRAGSSTDVLTDVWLADFEIDGINQAGVYSSAIKGIFITYQRRLRYEHIYMHDTAATALGSDFLAESFMTDLLITGAGRLNSGSQPGGNGIGVGTGRLSDEEALSVMGCVVKDTKRYGIFTERQSTGQRAKGIRVIGNWVRGCEVGIGDCGASGMVIEANDCLSNTRAGIAIDVGTLAASAEPGFGGLIQGNRLRSNGIGIHYDTTFTASQGEYNIRDNVIRDSVNSGIKVENGANALTGVSIRDNEIWRSGATGINLTPGSGVLSDVEIVGNRIYNSGQTNVNYHQGIRVEGSVVRLHIDGNHCHDNQTPKTQSYGLQIDAGAVLTDGTINYNDFRGNLTGVVLQNGTLTNTPVRGNEGFNGSGAPTVVTLGASPFTYTAGARPEFLYLFGGTVTSVTKSGQTVALGSNREFALGPNESIVITYTIVPTLVRDTR